MLASVSTPGRLRGVAWSPTRRPRAPAVLRALRLATNAFSALARARRRGPRESRASALGSCAVSTSRWQCACASRAASTAFQNGQRTSSSSRHGLRRPYRRSAKNPRAKYSRAAGSAPARSNKQTLHLWHFLAKAPKAPSQSDSKKGSQYTSQASRTGYAPVASAQYSAQRAQVMRPGRRVSTILDRRGAGRSMA